MMSCQTSIRDITNGRLEQRNGLTNTDNTGNEKGSNSEQYLGGKGLSPRDRREKFLTHYAEVREKQKYGSIY